VDPVIEAASPAASGRELEEEVSDLARVGQRRKV